MMVWIEVAVIDLAVSVDRIVTKWTQKVSR